MSNTLRKELKAISYNIYTSVYNLLIELCRLEKKHNCKISINNNNNFSILTYTNENINLNNRLYKGNGECFIKIIDIK